MSSYEFGVKFYQQFAPVLAAGAFCGCFSASRDQEDEWSTYTFNRKNTGATLLRDADRIATGTRPVNEKIVEILGLERGQSGRTREARGDEPGLALGPIHRRSLGNSKNEIPPPRQGLSI